MRATRFVVPLPAALGLLIAAAQPAGAGSRDPFWPVDWRPPTLGRSVNVQPASDTRVRWDEAARKLVITGITMDGNGRNIAVLKNLGVVEAGDVVSVSHQGLAYRWRIKEITDKGITPERLGVFPMK